MELEYGAYSLQGKKSRPNEDRYRLLGNKVPLVSRSGRGQLFAVFDGIGGAPKGRESAQAMWDCLVRFYNSADDGNVGVSAISAILVEANREIYNWGFIPGTRRPQGGCAGTIAWFHQNELYICHAGDTVGYLISGDAINPLTREHGEGKYIANYFGIGEKLLIDSFSFPLNEGDVLVLVSDGVTKALSRSSIQDCVGHWVIRSAEVAARQLCELALQRGSTDDITAVVVEVVEFSS